MDGKGGYTLANFANLTATLNLDINNFARGLQKASGKANTFASNLKGQINDGMIEPAKKAKFEYKDVARIVQGILISKVFYTGFNRIRQATQAVWEFSQELEYADMVYTNLFGDATMAEEFINVLKDFAAITPYSFQQSEQAAKRLLAYGIQAENVMYVMKGVLGAAAVQSNPAIVESISRALGQIYTKGRLMNEEMRQLAEAGIPVYDILQQKLNLTTEQLRNLGDNAIDANIAINALVDGITERYGSALDQSSRTTKGIISNIKDNSLMMFSSIFKSLTDSMHMSLSRLGEFVETLRTLYELKGVGGIFEHLVPPELHAALRSLFVSFMNLWSIIKTLLGSAGALKGALTAIVHILNAFLPIINGVLGVAVALVRTITGNTKAMRILTSVIVGASLAWVMFKIRAVAAAIAVSVIRAIISAMTALSVVMTALVSHPLWALLALGVGLFAALTGASNKFGNSVRKAFNGLTSLGGVDSSKVLLPESKERAADLGKFNKKLNETSDGMDNLADKTGAAAKAAKALLGFDEVFSLKSPDTGTGGITDSMDDIPDFGAGLDGLWEEIDYDGMANSFVSNILDAFGGTRAILSAGIGAILGGVLGGLLGGPVGAKIGAVVGAIASYFWNALADALNLTDAGRIAIPIATSIGAAIGFIVGGPAGAPIGAVIGLLVGWIIEEIAKGFSTGDWTQVSNLLAVSLGAVIGFVVGGPGGAMLGATIGFLVDWIINNLIDAVKGKEWNIVGGYVGAGIGAGIGAIIGGPAGALIGTALGLLASWIIGKFTRDTDWSKVGEVFIKPWKEFGSNAVRWFEESVWKPIKTAWDTGDWLGLGLSVILGIVKGLLKGPVLLFEAIRTVALSILGAFLQIFGIDVHSKAMVPIGESIIQGIIEGFVAKATALGNKITELGLMVYALVVLWGAQTKEGIREKLDEILVAFAAKAGEIYDKAKEVFGNMKTSIQTDFSEAVETVRSKLSEMSQTAREGLASVFTRFNTWKNDMWNNIFVKFFKWIDDGISKLKEFFKLDDKKSKGSTNVTSTPKKVVSLGGYATGGIVNKEQIARIAEGNKKEAVIPLENDAAMQPFVNAVSNGLSAALLPMLSSLSSSNSDNNLQPLYVGTLIADERGLKELNRKMQVIQIGESTRRGE